MILKTVGKRADGILDMADDDDGGDLGEWQQNFRIPVPPKSSQAQLTWPRIHRSGGLAHNPLAYDIYRAMERLRNHHRRPDTEQGSAAAQLPHEQAMNAMENNVDNLEMDPNRTLAAAGQGGPSLSSLQAEYPYEVEVDDVVVDNNKSTGLNI